MNEKVVLPFSGGLDSTVLLYKLRSLKYAVEPLFFIYGSGTRAARERTAVQAILSQLELGCTEIELPFVSEHLYPALQGSTTGPGEILSIPFRNGIFLSIATSLAKCIGANIVAIGINKEDAENYPDCTREFLANMEQAAFAATCVVITFPFVNYEKKAVIKLGSSLEVPFEDTYSCYRGGEKHCGRCGACKMRQKGFREAEVWDPTEYEVTNER